MCARTLCCFSTDEVDTFSSSMVSADSMRSSRSSARCPKCCAVWSVSCCFCKARLECNGHGAVFGHLQQVAVRVGALEACKLLLHFRQHCGAVTAPLEHLLNQAPDHIEGDEGAGQQRALAVLEEAATTLTSGACCIR